MKREKRRTTTKFAERDLFLFYFKEDKVIDIAQNGLECEETEFNYLGKHKITNQICSLLILLESNSRRQQIGNSF